MIPGSCHVEWPCSGVECVETMVPMVRQGAVEGGNVRRGSPYFDFFQIHRHPVAVVPGSYPNWVIGVLMKCPTCNEVVSTASSDGVGGLEDYDLETLGLEFDKCGAATAASDMFLTRGICEDLVVEANMVNITTMHKRHEQKANLANQRRLLSRVKATNRGLLQLSRIDPMAYSALVSKQGNLLSPFGDAKANGLLFPSKHAIESVQMRLLTGKLDLFRRVIQSVQCSPRDPNSGLADDATFPMARGIEAHVDDRDQESERGDGGGGGGMQLVNFTLSSKFGTRTAGGIFVGSGHFDRKRQFLVDAKNNGVNPGYYTTDNMPVNEQELKEIFDDGDGGETKSGGHTLKTMLDLKHAETRVIQTMHSKFKGHGDNVRSLTQRIQNLDPNSIGDIMGRIVAGDFTRDSIEICESIRGERGKAREHC